MRWVRHGWGSSASIASETPTRHGDQACRHGDSGATLIEILIAVVLLGLTVSAVLVAVRTTTTASAIDRDHAITFSWLQAASDEVYREPRVPCNVATDPAATYTGYAQSAPRPPRWPTTSGATIAVTNVEYLGKANPDAEFEWDAGFCFEGGLYADSPLYTQRITITAVSPDGLIKTLQMVKNEG